MRNLLLEHCGITPWEGFGSGAATFVVEQMRPNPHGTIAADRRFIVFARRQSGLASGSSQKQISETQ